MSADDALREHVLNLIRSAGERRFDEAMGDFPVGAMNANPPHVDYTPWHLLEHIRLAQADILDYIRNPRYVAPAWPAGYWPAKTSTADAAAWAASLSQFRTDQQALEDLIANPQTDLTAPIAHTPGHTLLREVFLVAGHNAFHVGEFAILRQVMQTWPPDHRG